MSLGWTITDLRATHTRSVGIMTTLQKRKEDHHKGQVQFAKDTWEEREADSQKRAGRPLPWGYTTYLDYWPDEWTPEEEAALANIEKVVRQLDQYAHPRNQVFGGAVV